VNLSGSELLLLLVITLLAFGAHRLPDATRAMGKGLREFKRALNDARDAVGKPEGPPSEPSPPPPPPPLPPRRRLLE
jgi:sec-independent protein translocase protein TatA